MTSSPDKRARERPRFVYLLHVAQRRVHAAIQSSGDGHTAARAGLLLALSPDRGTPMAELARALDLGAPALSTLLDRAARARQITRVPDPEDGRAWIIALTRTGIAARTQAIAAARALNARLCEGFSDDELAIVARWLSATCAKFPRPHRPNDQESDR
jgi:DNA-binding MarR family transcriptional regulator